MKAFYKEPGHFRQEMGTGITNIADWSQGKMVGLVDQLNSPAFSTSVGLLYFALAMNESTIPARGGRFVSKGGGSDLFSKILEFLKKISP
jgi:hypothetical protein